MPGCVVKFGGSLLQSPQLDAWLECLRALARHSLVLVPGGGCFAEQVRDSQRQLGFSDSIAHDMAVLGMAQYGLVLAERLKGAFQSAHTIACLRRGLLEGRAMLWLPRPPLFDERLAADWSCTADSIGLWLAMQLRATRYALIKATPQSLTALRPLRPEKHAKPPPGLLDAHFASMQGAYTGGVYVFGAEEQQAFADFLRAPSYEVDEIHKNGPFEV